MLSSYASAKILSTSRDNPAADKILLAGTLGGVETLALRLQWVLNQTGVSARGLSLKAGLAGGHVGLMLRGTAGKRPSDETIAKLARAAGVSHEWLARGEGEPGLRPHAGHTPPLHVELTERYAGRAEAEKAMRGVLPDPAVDSVLRWDLNATQDPGALWWIERMKEAARQLGLWQKDPAAERRELEKRRADTDALEAEEDALLKAGAPKPREASNDAPPPAANDAAKKRGGRKG